MSHELQEQHSFVLDENQSLREEIKECKEVCAKLQFQRDVLLELTWLDLPSANLHESATRWRELFAQEWERRDVVDQLKSEVARLTLLGERITELETENFNLRETRLQDAQALCRMQERLEQAEGIAP